jgi:hypothetical protein
MKKINKQKARRKPKRKKKNPLVEAAVEAIELAEFARSIGLQHLTL